MARSSARCLWLVAPLIVVTGIGTYGGQSSDPAKPDMILRSMAGRRSLPVLLRFLSRG